jgi:Domain of unknown function (DUF6438)
MLALGACWTGEVPPPAPAPVTPARPLPELAVTLERTECFGMCPAYRVSISRDGAVQWHGESNVAAVGDRNGRIARAQLTQIDEMIDRIGFFEYNEFGERQTPMSCSRQNNTCSWQSFTICSDTSHVVITVRRKGVDHRVDDARCGESKIDDLGKLIDKLAKTERWIHGE